MIYFLKEKRYHEQTIAYIDTEKDYEYVKQIGEGAYGVAYLLEHVQSKQQVVLKRLKVKHLRKKTLNKFNKEIEFLYQLQHLPVPQILTKGIIEKAPFYLMTYASGETFEQAIFDRNQTFSIHDTIYFTHQLLNIVSRMHEANIVHRDLRIPNIILKDGQLTIIDFGLAAQIDPNFQVDRMKNPKKAAHPVSDLYAIGHFMLFLLYSHFEPTSRKSKSWQQELQLPQELQHFIERLLTIDQPFSSAYEAIDYLKDVSNKIRHEKKPPI